MAKHLSGSKKWQDVGVKIRGRHDLWRAKKNKCNRIFDISVPHRESIPHDRRKSDAKRKVTGMANVTKREQNLQD